MFKKSFIQPDLLMSFDKNGKLVFANLELLHVNSLTILFVFRVLLGCETGSKNDTSDLRFFKANLLHS